MYVDVTEENYFLRKAHSISDASKYALAKANCLLKCKFLRALARCTCNSYYIARFPYSARTLRLAEHLSRIIMISGV